MRPLGHNYLVMALSGLENTFEQFYFIATIPLVLLSHILFILKYYQCHLVVSCNLHTVLEDMCDNATGEIFILEFDFCMFLNHP